MIIKFEDINFVKISHFKEIPKKHRYPFIHKVLIEFVLTLLSLIFSSNDKYIY